MLLVSGLVFWLLATRLWTVLTLHFTFLMCTKKKFMRRSDEYLIDFFFRTNNSHTQFLHTFHTHNSNKQSVHAIRKRNSSTKFLHAIRTDAICTCNSNAQVTHAIPQNSHTQFVHHFVCTLPRRCSRMSCEKKILY